jgi:lambda repressor-like predicted transcriptional regulator
MTSITTTDQLTIDDLRQRGVRVDALLKRLVISPYNLSAYLSGRVPAAWIRQEIADAIGIDPSQLWRIPTCGTSQTTPQRHTQDEDDTSLASKGARAGVKRSIDRVRRSGCFLSPPELQKGSEGANPFVEGANPDHRERAC